MVLVGSSVNHVCAYILGLWFGEDSLIVQLKCSTESGNKRN